MRNILAMITVIGIICGLAYVVVQKVPITISLLVGFCVACFVGGFMFDLQEMKKRWAPVQESLDELAEDYEKGKEAAEAALKAEKKKPTKPVVEKASEEELEDPPAEVEKPKFESKVIRRPETKKVKVEAGA